MPTGDFDKRNSRQVVPENGKKVKKQRNRRKKKEDKSMEF